jgi:hypothetical protein
MNPVESLSRILAKKEAVKTATGVVSKVEGRTVYMVDRGGTRVANILPGDASLYKPGDRVQLEGGILVGKVMPRRSKKFYL